MIFFISDTHFLHSNILEYCSRPFSSTQEMDEQLISNWNSVIGQEDEVYHLGDFALGNKFLVDKILTRLLGKIHFIRGNHDQWLRKSAVAEQRLVWVKDYYELKVQDEEMDLTQFLVMSHYPILSWNKASHGSWMLHGHVHSTTDPLNETTARLDVGVDSHKYFPISYEQIKNIMTKRVFKPIDHHGSTNRD